MLFQKKNLQHLWHYISFRNFDDALNIVKEIYKTGGAGHSLLIYSYDDKNIKKRFQKSNFK